MGETAGYLPGAYFPAFLNRSMSVPWATCAGSSQPNAQSGMQGIPWIAGPENQAGGKTYP